MKRFIFMAVLALITLSTRAQTDSLEVHKPKYSVRPGLITENEKKEIATVEAFRQRHLYQAGIAMQKGVFCIGGTVASSLAGGICFAIGEASDNYGLRTGMFVGGGIMMAASLGFTIATIHFHNKAGHELRLSAGEVIYKF